MPNFAPPVIDRKFIYFLLEVLCEPWSVNDQKLKETFEQHGTVISAKIITDRDTQRSRGFGFVEMENSTDASKAIKALNDSEIDGRNIVVNEAKARS